MPGHICSIVPPYLLRSIADSQATDDETRQRFLACLEHRDHYTGRRCERFSVLSQPRAARAAGGAPRGIVPETLLQHIADCEDVDEETRSRARADMERTRRAISTYQKGLIQREESEGSVAVADAGKSEGETPGSSGFYRAVYDAKNDNNEENLPGELVRVEGQKPSADQAVNEAYDNVGRVLDFYLEQFKWRSIDNKNENVISTVHFGQKYGNAFWDPERRQMVFGDGDEFIGNFTGCLDVIGHELTVSTNKYPCIIWFGSMNNPEEDCRVRYNKNGKLSKQRRNGRVKGVERLQRARIVEYGIDDRWLGSGEKCDLITEMLTS